MTEKVYRSKCCNAKARADGVPDFLGSEEVRTVSYTCLKCGKPCDVVKLRGQKQRALKERIKYGKKRLDFQGKILKKLIDFFDGITIHPVKGVILTPKKKRQLGELRAIEQRFFKSK